MNESRHVITSPLRGGQQCDTAERHTHSGSGRCTKYIHSALLATVQQRSAAKDGPTRARTLVQGVKALRKPQEGCLRQLGTTVEGVECVAAAR